MNKKKLESLTKEELISLVEEKEKVIESVKLDLSDLRSNEFSYLEVAPDLIFLVDKSGNIIYRNSASEELISRELEESVGSGYIKYLPKSIRERAGEIFTNVISKGEVVKNEEFEIAGPDGRVYFLIANLSPVKSGEGEIIGLLAIFRDISGIRMMEDKVSGYARNLEKRIKDEHKQAEDLKSVTALNEEIIQKSPIGIFLMDPSGIMLSENPALKEIMGIPQDETRVGFNLYEYKGFIDSGIQKAFDNVLHTKKPARYEQIKYMPVSQKAEVTINLWIDPILDTENNIKYLLFMAEDITIQSQLANRVKRAEKLSAMSLLGAGIAEELKMPVSHMTVDLNFIENNTEEGSPMLPYIQSMKEDLSRIQFISEELLNLSRPGETVDGMEFIELTKLAASHPIKIKLDRIRDRGIEVKSLMPEVSPWVKANKNQLVQVLIHIIANAGDAMPYEGSLTVSVDTMEKNGSKFASITVEDTGIGFTKENLQKAFQPFFSTKGNKGTGLGLMVASSIIESINGVIGIKSKPGEGTTVRILLPAHNK